MKKILLPFVIFCLCFVFSNKVFATFETPSGTSYNQVTSTGSVTTTNYWNAVSNSLYLIGVDIQNMYTDLHSSTSYLSTIKNDVASIKSSVSGGSSSSGPSGSNYKYYFQASTSGSTNYWSAVTNSLYYIGNDFHEFRSSFSSYTTSFSSYTTSFETAKGYLSDIKFSVDTVEDKLASIISKFTTLNDYVSDLHDVFANQTDRNLRNYQESNMIRATSDFLSGTSSSTSVGTGNISSVKSTFNSAQSFFGMGEGIDVFGSLSDQTNDGPWFWFSQSVSDDLNNVQYPRDVVYIDFLSDKYNDLNLRLGGEEGDNR